MIVCFGTQKGGVGKSTLTNQLATYIHLKTDYSVKVIDADFIQGSLISSRNYEVKYYIDYIKKGFNEGEFTPELEKALTKEYVDNCYPLMASDYANLQNIIIDNSEDCDFLLVDLPGTVSAKGIITIYASFDFVFVPTDITFKDLDATRKFLEMYDSSVRPEREKMKLKCNIYGVFNKVKENTIEFKQRDEIIKKHDIKIPFLKNYITETTQLKREDSTVETIALGGLKNNKMISNFASEIINLMLN